MMKNQIALAIASVFYIGFIPGAPGTYGSCAASLAFFLIHWPSGAAHPLLHLGAVILITFVG
ncbi:MAG TPA: hypothetical protein VLL97_14850, partial [Acidobacteriota bacterium]|nr:hypothetical protein [Acidobacteriota bacterium]